MENNRTFILVGLLAAALIAMILTAEPVEKPKPAPVAGTIHWEFLEGVGLEGMDVHASDAIRTKVPGGWIYRINPTGTPRNLYVPDPKQWRAPPPVPAEIEPGDDTFDPGKEEF